MIKEINNKEGLRLRYNFDSDRIETLSDVIATTSAAGIIPARDYQDRTRLVSLCHICGEPCLSINDHICEECKAAVLYIRHAKDIKADKDIKELFE